MHCASVVSNPLWPYGPWPASLLCQRYSPGKNTGVGSHSSSRLSSWPRDLTQVSGTAGRFFTVWATREALNVRSISKYFLKGQKKVLAVKGNQWINWVILELRIIISQKNSIKEKKRQVTELEKIDACQKFKEFIQITNKRSQHYKIKWGKN